MDAECEFFTDRLWFMDGHPSRKYYTPMGVALPQPPGVVLLTAAPASPPSRPQVPPTAPTGPPTQPAPSPSSNTPQRATDAAMLQSVLDRDDLWNSFGSCIPQDIDSLLDLGSPTMSELHRISASQPGTPHVSETTGKQASDAAGARKTSLV